MPTIVPYPREKLSSASDSAYIGNLVEDLTPQLGGDLDLNGKNIDFPSTANISDCLDEDDMVSDSATKLATQQSIKAYVDNFVRVTVSTLAPADNTDANTDVQTNDIYIKI